MLYHGKVQEGAGFAGWATKEQFCLSGVIFSLQRAVLGGSVVCVSDWRSHTGDCRFALPPPKKKIIIIIGNILLWRLIMKNFLRPFSSTDLRRVFRALNH